MTFILLIIIYSFRSIRAQEARTNQVAASNQVIIEMRNRVTAHPRPVV